LSALFTIYRSSAGSGKTRTLAKEYLKLALQYRATYFRHILAVTFTNKSTQEMKDRIISYLNDFSNGSQNELALELQQELNLDPATFQNYAQEVRSELLHNYSQFSISTIDAFFQKVIRSFTREAGLAGDFRLEVDTEPILMEVIEKLIDELGKNKTLTNWVVEFANESLDSNRAWDVRHSLLEFSKELFREEFKQIQRELNQKTSEHDFFNTTITELKKIRKSFLDEIRNKTGRAVAIIQQHELTLDDFKYSGGGAYSWFIKLTIVTGVDDLTQKEIGSRPKKEYQLSKNWPDKDTPHQAVIEKLADEKLIPLLNEILEYHEHNYSKALSAELALNNFYHFGLIADISRKLSEYKDENGIMLLADAPNFLSGVIRDSDTPFIYEKVGSFYKNFLIDEFQDTSRMQWSNFLPLLTNGLDQGYPSMVVGDVKQAVYRWRGGDLKLLQQEVVTHVGEGRTSVKPLKSNFRSAENIVLFNNALFKTAADSVSAQTGHAISIEAYDDIKQEIIKSDEGFVDISFLKDDKEIKWEEQSLELIPKHLEALQQMGAQLKDIAILVRKNDEGKAVVAHLLRYKNSPEAKPDCSYDVVSSESLQLDGAGTVNLLVSALKYLLNAEDNIARAQLSYEYARLHQPEREHVVVFSITDQKKFEKLLPPEFAREKSALKKLPLFELTESLIRIFELGSFVAELTYLQTFQDLVLDFASRERNDLAEFLLWWEENKSKKSIQVSGEVNAAQILTVHKSKGLQFKYVLIPFCSWDLDHGKKTVNLWVKSEASPFNHMGYLPVRYSDKLQDTLFADYYAEERARCYLDNLNLLYVALTRAEHGLIVMARQSVKSDELNTVGDLLYYTIQQTSELAAGWNSQHACYKSGEWVAKQTPHKTETNEAMPLPGYVSTPWRNKLVIKQSAKGYLHSQAELVDKARYGIYIHTVLSRIKYQDEWQAAVDQLLAEGLITEKEKPEISALLNELFSDSIIAGWFARHWQVRTEVPVLLPGAFENRIDRLLLQDKKAIVIDFKTGSPSKNDVTQVANYMSTLVQMNFNPVEGYLLYIKTGEVVPVMSGKSSKSKSESKNQLGLGL
jgi:ATP-dependent helicase/nuclease subunit A